MERENAIEPRKCKKKTTNSICPAGNARSQPLVISRKDDDTITFAITAEVTGELPILCLNKWLRKATEKHQMISPNEDSVASHDIPRWRRAERTVTKENKPRFTRRCRNFQAREK